MAYFLTTSKYSVLHVKRQIALKLKNRIQSSATSISIHLGETIKIHVQAVDPKLTIFQCASAIFNFNPPSIYKNIGTTYWIASPLSSNEIWTHHPIHEIIILNFDDFDNFLKPVKTCLAISERKHMILSAALHDLLFTNYLDFLFSSFCKKSEFHLLFKFVCKGFAKFAI